MPALPMHPIGQTLAVAIAIWTEPVVHVIPFRIAHVAATRVILPCFLAAERQDTRYPHGLLYVGPDKTPKPRQRQAVFRFARP